MRNILNDSKLYLCTLNIPIIKHNDATESLSCESFMLKYLYKKNLRYLSTNVKQHGYARTVCEETC